MTMTMTRASRRPLRALLDRLARFERRRRQRADLLRLDDRLLRNIGVTRAEVARELRQPLRALSRSDVA